MIADSFFTTDDGDWFRPTEVCRGPWDPDACHAGPPTGLLARASEALLPDQQLVRLTVDLTRPIPHAGFRIDGEIVRAGRTVSTAAFAIVDGDGRTVVTARSMHVAPQPTATLPTATADTPRFADARPDRFPITMAGHELTAFSSGTEVRYPPGDEPTPGPTRIWMRTVPLLPDEAGSGFQRICPLADCGNAVSRNTEPTTAAFLNTDLTIVWHREPVGEWFGMDSVSRWEPNGLGMSDSLLFDDEGPVGRAVQAILVQPRDQG